MSCKCQSCGRQYTVDFNVPNDIWHFIKPAGKSDEGGLLCGHCIVGRIEGLVGHGAFQVVRPEEQ